MAEFNRFELEGFAKIAAEDYLNNGSDLNDRITGMARENEFTDHHIDRVVQMTNTFVNGELVKQARSEQRDPRVKFELASGEKVRESLNSDRVKAAELRERAELADLFDLGTPAADHGRVLDGVFGKLAGSPYQGAKSVSHEDLTRSYVFEPDRLEKVASHIDSRSIGLAQQSLETLAAEARSDLGVQKLAMAEAEQGIRDEINDQLLTGMSPASLRAVFNSAYEGQPLNDYLDGLVTKVAARLGVREGRNAFVAGSTVNADHPLMAKSAALMDCLRETAKIDRGHKKAAEAVKRARADYALAVGQGR